MWAFLLHDRARGELFVSRDRFGVKPLHCCRAGRTLLFASEIKGLLAHPEVVTSPNLPCLQEYLGGTHAEWSGDTPFSGVFRFPFAHHALIKLDRGDVALDPVRYWDFTPDLSKEPYDEVKAGRYAADYHDLLKDAVRLRLRSDVAVGLALSGGLDSSSIVHLVDELQRESGLDVRQKAFSTVHTLPETRHLDESGYP
jgi:asparagine synthase (glutamine-hydrolysing)